MTTEAKTKTQQARAANAQPITGAAALATQAQGQAVQRAQRTPVDELKDLLGRARQQILDVIPKHLTVERLTNLALSAAAKSVDLQKCSTMSVVRAVRGCAELGLEPNTAAGQAYLVPYNVKTKGADGRETWGKECQLIIGYRGMIDLARRGGDLVQIEAHAVRERDIFDFRFGLEPKLEHVPFLRGDPGPTIAFYCIARLADGSRHVEVMSKAEVDAIRARSKAGNSGPWVSDYDEMGKKTVIRRAWKFLPISTEKISRSLAERGGDVGHLDDDRDATLDLDPVTGEIVGGSQTAQPRATKTDRLAAQLAEPVDFTEPAREEAQPAEPVPAAEPTQPEQQAERVPGAEG